MKATTLNEFLADFEPVETNEERSMRQHRPLTLWVPTDLHARFARLQKTSGRKFGKKLREVVQAMVDMAEARKG